MEEVKKYRIILDTEERTGHRVGQVFISEEGALKIWAAYEKLYGKNCQSMDQRESRGGICWLSEIGYWKGLGGLDKDFDYTLYQVDE